MCTAALNMVSEVLFQSQRDQFGTQGTQHSLCATSSLGMEIKEEELNDELQHSLRV